MPDEWNRYRLPGATFPLKFKMHGHDWQLTVFLVEGGGHWRCYLEGPTLWNISTGYNEKTVLKELLETGVAIPSRTFVGTAFRHLEALKLAERVHGPTSSASSV